MSSSSLFLHRLVSITWIMHLFAKPSHRRWYTRVLIVIETTPHDGGGVVRLEVLYHKNWGWGVYPGPTENLLKEMPRVDIFVWNIGLHSLYVLRVSPLLVLNLLLSHSCRVPTCSTLAFSTGLVSLSSSVRRLGLSCSQVVATAALQAIQTRGSISQIWQFVFRHFRNV